MLCLNGLLKKVTDSDNFSQKKISYAGFSSEAFDDFRPNAAAKQAKALLRAGGQRRRGRRWRRHLVTRGPAADPEELPTSAFLHLKQTIKPPNRKPNKTSHSAKSRTHLLKDARATNTSVVTFICLKPASDFPPSQFKRGTSKETCTVPIETVQTVIRPEPLALI